MGNMREELEKLQAFKNCNITSSERDKYVFIFWRMRKMETNFKKIMSLLETNTFDDDGQMSCYFKPNSEMCRNVDMELWKVKEMGVCFFL